MDGHNRFAECVWRWGLRNVNNEHANALHFQYICCAEYNPVDFVVVPVVASPLYITSYYSRASLLQNIHQWWYFSLSKYRIHFGTNPFRVELQIVMLTFYTIKLQPIRRNDSVGLCMLKFFQQKNPTLIDVSSLMSLKPYSLTYVIK